MKTCQFVVEPLDPDPESDEHTPPSPGMTLMSYDHPEADKTCGAPAGMRADGYWLCAKHWDMWMRARPPYERNRDAPL